MRFWTMWSRLATVLVVLVAAVAMAVPQSSWAGLSLKGPHDCIVPTVR